MEGCAAGSLAVAWLLWRLRYAGVAVRVLLALSGYSCGGCVALVASATT